MVIGANLRRKNKYIKDSSQEKKKAIVRENHCRLLVQTIIKAQSGTVRCELRMRDDCATTALLRKCAGDSRTPSVEMVVGCGNVKHCDSEGKRRNRNGNSGSNHCRLHFR